MQLNFLSSQIIHAAIQIHKKIGPGLFESVYKECMIIELSYMGLKTEREVAVPVKYRDKDITDLGYRLDLLVENSIILELKSVNKIKDVHKKQLLTYMRLMQKELGLLINFNEVLLKDGITRIINNLH